MFRLFARMHGSLPGSTAAVDGATAVAVADVGLAGAVGLGARDQLRLAVVAPAPGVALALAQRRSRRADRERREREREDQRAREHPARRYGRGGPLATRFAYASIASTQARSSMTRDHSCAHVSPGPAIFLPRRPGSLRESRSIGRFPRANQTWGGLVRDSRDNFVTLIVPSPRSRR